jgi:hypothetical protein
MILFTVPLIDFTSAINAGIDQCKAMLEGNYVPVLEVMGGMLALGYILRVVERFLGGRR